MFLHMGSSRIALPTEMKILAVVVAVLFASAILFLAARHQGPVLDDTTSSRDSTLAAVRSGDSTNPGIEGLPDNDVAVMNEPAAVVFPDGKSVVVTFRPYPTPELEDSVVDRLDNGTDPGFYELLRPLAESGNGFAALRLAQALVGCLGVPETQDELDSHIDQLHQTRTQPMVGPGVRRFGEGNTVFISDDANPFEQEEQLTALFRRCQGVSGNMKTEVDLWLETSAELGSFRGMVVLAEEIKSSDPARAKSIYEDLWSKGYVSAAGDLARLFENGGDGLEPDPIMAYAYGYIYLELFRLSRDETVEADSSVLQRLWQQGLAVRERRQRKLMPNELEQASTLARRLLESNDSCCYHLYSTKRR